MIKLIQVALRCMMKHRQQKGSMMTPVFLSDEDKAQVKAILMTHAEMQDRRTLDGEQIIGRLRAEGDASDTDVLEMIEDLEQTGEELIEDTENLKRIALKF